MKKIVAILILLAAAGGGYYYYSDYSKPPEKPQVVQGTISRGDVVEAVVATGTLLAVRVVQVGSQVSGIVSDLYADFNSMVKKDQIIARIDPSLLQVQVDLQEAAVERQKGEIANQEVQLENDMKNLERTRQLFSQGLANQQQMDQSELTVRTRRTQLESARKTLLTNEANLNQAKLNLSYSIIRSPIDGVVINRQVDVGQAVSANMNVAQFFTLATDLRTLKLQAGVDEADISKIRPGMRVLFTVDSFGPQTEFEGTVETVRLNAQNQNNVVTYPVWINVPNADLRLRPSLTASLRILVSTATNAIRIPNAALRFRPTPDIYTALGLTPPTPQGRGGQAGEGRGGRQGGAAGQTASNDAQTPAAAAQPQGEGQQQAAAQGGQQQGQGRQGGFQGARGGGRGGFANLSPEEAQRRMQEFAARGGGRGRNGGRGGAMPASTLSQIPTEGDFIDEQWAPLERPNAPGTVWTWDEAGKKLEQHRLRIGVTDGSFTEMISGDLQVDQQVVTSVIIPQTSAQRNQQNIFGNQGRGAGGGRGGLQPGGLPAGGGGGGGGGFGGGGGGGRGGGGGGGGF